MLLRKFVRSSKHDDLVEEVELTHANPSYAHIRYSDGRESTVSLADLAPCPRDDLGEDERAPNKPNPIIHSADESPRKQTNAADDPNGDVTTPEETYVNLQETLPTESIRRSTGQKKKPVMYGFEE